MSFVVRGARPDDVSSLVALARQFSLLNLPPEKKAITRKIERSQASFRGEVERSEALYLFVIEDTESRNVVGSSQIMAKVGTPENPSYSFQILKRERFSKSLGIGFIHQVLRLKVNEDGPTEVGGLVVDRNYRRRPEQVGKQVGLARFHFIGMKPDLFEDILYAEMAPPLTDEGRSEFWEALGRRFTGMPYSEADLLSQSNKEFISSLFPNDDIYLCLLDSQARLVLGRVGPETQGALHMLTEIGFAYNNEVDPFDGGPHIQVAKKDLALFQQSRWVLARKKSNALYGGQALVGVCRGHEYFSVLTAYDLMGDDLHIPEKAWSLLRLTSGESVYFMPLEKSQAEIRES